MKLTVRYPHPVLGILPSLCILAGCFVTIVTPESDNYAGQETQTADKLQVRLSGGFTPSEGQVLVFKDGHWRTVCDTEWGLPDADVVCWQLGYGYASMAWRGAHFGEPTGPEDDNFRIILTCTGRETELSDCSHRMISSDSCGKFKTAGVRCSNISVVHDNQIRLVGGLTPNIGRVEIYHKNRTWSVVCDESWDMAKAGVVCRDLGYAGAIADRGKTLIHFDAAEISQTAVDALSCSGLEAKVANCEVGAPGRSRCQEPASVSCLVAGPSENSIRLSGGKYPMEGRVEVYLNGAWATVCGDRWDMADAEVVCRQLGFTHATAALVRAHFGPGSGPILLDEVECIGDEEALVHCRARRMHQLDCQHGQDAAVRCDNRRVSQDYSVRLSGGATPNAGRLEILMHGLWHTVCDVTGVWDIREAEVVCRELGFPRALAPWAKITGVLERAWGGRSFESVECRGNETKIAECWHGVVGETYCGGLEHEARVLCEPRPLGKLPYLVRLEGGRTPTEGSVQIFQDNHWLPVCGDDWGIADARVVCKQLGYHFAKSAATRRERSGAALTEQLTNNRAQMTRTLRWVLSEFQCTGHEDHLLQCGYREGQRAGCGRDMVAQAVCSDKPSMPAGERLRLSGSAGENEGRVEVYFDGMWWKVCGDDWDIRDASVVCRQLGYPSELANYTLADRFLGDAVCRNGVENSADFENFACDLEYLMSDLQCTGNESSVVECRHAGFGQQYCSMNHDAAVVCDGERSKLAFEARLGASDSSRPYEGRVELHHDDRWWLVCAAGWDHHDATVLCQQLGFPGVASPDLQPSYKIKGSTNMGFLLDDVQCDGTEDNIAECLHGGVGRGRCEGQVAVGVRCRTDSLVIQGEDIRLIGGDSVLEGRVEVYHNQRWWTICDDNWNIKAADVACRQLGLPSAESAVFGAYFGRGHETMGILLDEVDCKGSEGNLLECSHHVLEEHDCNHAQDAGVRCSPPTVHHQLKLPKPIRLSGGDNTTKGRVEIYHSFRWWTVCRSGNLSVDNKSALIACRQLDFSSGQAVVPAGEFGTPPKYTRVLLAGLQCTGKERNLTLCRHHGLGVDRGCGHDQDLAVRCVDNDLDNEVPRNLQNRQRRSGPTTPVLAVIIATVFVTGFLIGSAILYHVYKACDRFLSRHPAAISGDAVRSPSFTANTERVERGREAKESVRNKDMYIELYPLPPVPTDGEDTETDGGEDHEYSDWERTPIRRETNSAPPPNTPDTAYDGTLV